LRFCVILLIASLFFAVTIMKSFAILAVLGAAISPAFASIVARQSKGKLPTVSVKGNAFFAGNERFYVRGVAYQPGS
jgi:amino acid permease